MAGWILVVVTAVVVTLAEGQRENKLPYFLPDGDMKGFTLRFVVVIEWQDDCFVYLSVCYSHHLVDLLFVCFLFIYVTDL